MVTIEVDLAGDSFPRNLVDGEDATAICPVIAGMKPDKLIVIQAFGPGGGNPFCHASFNDEKVARKWFAIVADDADPNWFNENVVA